LGLIVGPVYFWWIIGVGYTLGVLFWWGKKISKKTKIDILPVAPLLFLGFCAVLMIHILA
jgi:hypothetical protein